LKSRVQVKSFVQTQGFFKKKKRIAVVRYTLFIPVFSTHMKEEMFFALA